MKSKKLVNAQNQIDEKYGVGEWEIVLHNGGHQPCLLKHKCGKEKEVSRFSTFKLGKTKCECQHIPSSERGAGRPTLNFEELYKKVSEETYGNYELIEIAEDSKFIINHKSCDRKPFKTNSERFFNRGQRCACMKPGKQPRKIVEDEDGTDSI